MTQFNVIGDIHGRTCWKKLVQDDCINIFVGDYFDPYEGISYALLLQNFRDTIAYKQTHPKTILLYGNHDLHYLLNAERSSRYDALHADAYKQLFLEVKHLFCGIAYAIEDKCLITHAGVTKEWYENEFGEYNGEKPSVVANNINDLWQHNKYEFAFRTNASLQFDICGASPTLSPLWVRLRTLAEHNLFDGTPYKQVFGHTQIDDITKITDNLICVDCLGTITKSHRIVSDEHKTSVTRKSRQISIFNCVVAAQSQDIDLGTIIDMIRSDIIIRDVTKRYREYAAKGLKDELKKIKTKTLPACAPCALLYEGKARDNVIGLTDLCLLDIDHIENSQISTAMAILERDEHIVMAATSVSGNGLHILVRYGIRGWKTPPQRIKMGPAKMQKIYKKIFDCITKEYEQKLGLKTDRQAGNMERLLIISYDPDIYYNPDATPILIDTKTQSATICMD